ncbi:MAG TPA: hypothetical protein DHM44_05710, partial [Flexistipes sinusarabici]|nr:hypothetical protein [Flexistipes sinusarabici]
MRKHPLVTGNFYHVYTKSIASYEVFRTVTDYHRMVELMKFYAYEKRPTKFSEYFKIKDKSVNVSKYFQPNDKIVNMISYCLMPTHIHFL